MHRIKDVYFRIGRRLQRFEGLLLDHATRGGTRTPFADTASTVGGPLLVAGGKDVPHTYHNVHISIG